MSRCHEVEATLQLTVSPLSDPRPICLFRVGQNRKQIFPLFRLLLSLRYDGNMINVRYAVTEYTQCPGV
jgi:hypothetical protein